MNVLSIDFDIIMAPDIGLYNPLIRAGSEEKNVTLKKLCEDFPMLNNCRADLNHYQKIVNFLINNIKHLNPKDIRVSFTHEDIKHLLSGLSNVNMFSIDHHHDLGYVNPEDDVEENIPCTCANWGDFFLRDKTITHFTWLKNTNSSEHPIYSKDSRITTFNLSDYDLNDIPKIDKLFLCLSPEWTSEAFFPLFYLILDLINGQKNCHLEMH